MPRYIDADKLYDEIKSLRIHLDGKDIFTEEAKDTILECIANAYTEDVQEVKHGNWLIHRFGDDARCSKCRRVSFGAYNFESCDRFCRNCGAKMEVLKEIE